MGQPGGKRSENEKVTWGGKTEGQENERNSESDKRWDDTPRLNQRKTFPAFETDSLKEFHLKAFKVYLQEFYFIMQYECDSELVFRT
jgi:hypothetical protein